MNKKTIFTVCIVLLGLVAAEFIISHKKPHLTTECPRIGIIIPLTHPALTKIVNGFCGQLDALLGKKCEYLIRDAHGDQNVQQPAILDEMLRKNVDMIVPIGTLCTQMTLQKAPNIPVVALAATRTSIVSATGMATGVHDEIEAKESFSLIEKLVPNIGKIALIATQNEKTMSEIQAFRNEALNRGTAVQIIYVQSPSDMYLATHSVDQDTQAIHILKDHLVVSSIATINQLAHDRNIPVIASDEGSVEEGAACAIGVEEATIGKEGAELAAMILTGKSPGFIPVKTLEQLAVFVNKKACARQNASIKNLTTHAASKHFALVATSKSTQE